jgi:hypothetical protein
LQNLGDSHLSLNGNSYEIEAWGNEKFESSKHYNESKVHFITCLVRFVFCTCAGGMRQRRFKWAKTTSKHNVAAKARRRQGGQMRLVEKQAGGRVEAAGFSRRVVDSRVHPAEGFPRAANRSVAAAAS